MARITMSALAHAIRGRAGPLDFQGSPAGPRARIHSEPTAPPTAPQLEQRDSIGRSAALWASIKAAYAPWAELDLTEPLLSPMLLHHAAAVARIRAGTPWNLTPFAQPAWTAGKWKARSLALADVTLQSAARNDNASVIQGVVLARGDTYHRIGWWSPTRNDHWTRFVDCPVPQGATLTQAFLTYHARSTRAGAGTVYVVKAQAQDHAEQIVNLDAYDAMAWTTPTAPTSFGPWVTGEWYPSSSLTAVLQEVFDRPGYAQGNAVGLTTADPGTATDAREPDSWNNDPAYASKLYLEWGSAPTPPPDLWLQAEWDAGLDTAWEDFALARRDAGAWSYVLEELYGEPLTPNTLDFQVTPELEYYDLYFMLRDSIARAYQELPSIRCAPDGDWHYPHES